MAERSTARIAGILFIFASVAAIVGGSLLIPLEKDDYLAAVADAESQVVTGSIIEMVLVIAVVAIAITLYPVLRRRNEGMALGYVGARTLEGVLLLAASLTPLFVLSLSRDYGDGGVPGVQPLGDLLLATRDWTYLIGSLVALGVGALILYSLLYVTRLVPNWLSVWGLIGAGLVIVRGLLEMYGLDLNGVAQGLFAAPIAINEMVLAIWLIVKGFDSDALTQLDSTQPGQTEAASIAG